MAEILNTITNKKIDNAKILSSDDYGVIESIGSGSALRFTPKDIVNTNNAVTSEELQKVKIPDLPVGPDINPYDVSLPDYSENYINGRKYLFGIDKLEISQSVPSEVNGFISNSIDIENCSYIELAVKTEGTTEVEYSIIDGLKETPILPIDQLTVVHEKLFYKLDTRFTPDTSEKITIYKNDKETKYQYSQIKDLALNDGRYTISYTPLKTAHIYYPQNNKIKVKVIQRTQNGRIPSRIQSMVIIKHGGGTH